MSQDGARHEEHVHRTMAHVNAPLSVHRFRNNVSAHSLHDEDGGKKFSFPRTMIKNHQDCKTAATSTTCHFAHQRRLEHEFSQPAGAFVPDPMFSACVTQAACDRLSQTNAACVQPWQQRHSVDAIPSQRRAAATPARLRQGASASCNCACGRHLLSLCPLSP